MTRLLLRALSLFLLLPISPMSPTPAAGKPQDDEEDGRRRHGRGGEHDRVHRGVLVREAEEARRQVDAHDLELLDELRADAGRLEPALDLALEHAL